MPGKRSDALPEDVFHVITALFPEFIRISAEADIKAVELFTIWYLKNNGRPDDTGETVILRTEMTNVLGREIGFSDGAIDQHLARLEERKLVARRRISTMEKKRLFGTSSGRRGVVALLPDGARKIEEVKIGVNALFQRIVSQLPQPLRAGVGHALPVVAKIANFVLTRHRK